MIIEYHRPKELKEALELIGRSNPRTYPLGGGSSINQPGDEEFAVVDLQDLNLNQLQKNQNSFFFGAKVTLQNLLDFFTGLEPDSFAGKSELEKAIRHEASFNLRQVASIAGTIVSADGRSAFVTSLLALDAVVKVISQDGEAERINIGDLFPLWKKGNRGKLILEFEIPNNTNFVYQFVARTPADLPIVCCAVNKWPSNRIRGALGGYGDYPKMFFDGTDEGGIQIAAEDAYSQANDHWASSEYRSQIAGMLAKRCVNLISVS